MKKGPTQQGKQLAHSWFRLHSASRGSRRRENVYTSFKVSASLWEGSEKQEAGKGRGGGWDTGEGQAPCFGVPGQPQAQAEKTRVTRCQDMAAHAPNQANNGSQAQKPLPPNNISLPHTLVRSSREGKALIVGGGTITNSGPCQCSSHLCF